MLLCYAMLCNALKGAVPELSFLAKPYQPNGHDDQMEGDKLDTPTTHGHPWHGLNHRPAHNHDHDYDYTPNSYGLSSHDLDLRPRHFMHVDCFSTT